MGSSKQQLMLEGGKLPDQDSEAASRICVMIAISRRKVNEENAGNIPLSASGRIRFRIWSAGREFPVVYSGRLMRQCFS